MADDQGIKNFQITHERRTARDRTATEGSVCRLALVRNDSSRIVDKLVSEIESQKRVATSPLEFQTPSRGRTITWPAGLPSSDGDALVILLLHDSSFPSAAARQLVATVDCREWSPPNL